MISPEYLKGFHQEKNDQIYVEYFFYRNLWVSDDWPKERWEAQKQPWRCSIKNNCF